MKNIFKFTAIALIALTLTNCKKDKEKDPEPEPTPTPTTPSTAGSLKIEFEAMVGDSALVFNTETYTNQAGNTFNVSMYKYYISNIKITKMDNSVWTEPNSYHLIDHSNPSSALITLANVPFANYKAIEFMIGVDSARNEAGASGQTGDLDVANGAMYWSWNTGYIMSKFEGTTSGQNIKYHIGGWKGSYNSLKIVSPSFNSDTAKVTASITPIIHISNNLLEWFETPTIVDFSTFNAGNKVIMSASASSKTIADNYADMFTVEHIHND
jgi:hypothetical protein